MYLYSTRIHLDSAPDVVHSAVPDRVHSDTKKGKKSGQLVKIKDVLDHKDDDEFWVVISGHVYKLVHFPQNVRLGGGREREKLMQDW